MSKKILMTGNEAIAEAAIQAGCRFYAGYPITPQNEIPAYMARRMPEVGGVFIQSESELAAINMVFGAAATGARAMTSSSSPGISLKQEGISYLAGAQLPCVIVNVMRGGPGLGNIAPAQSDYFQATKGGGHGDYHCIVLAPSNIQEARELTILAFDLADKYRSPVMILGDGMLGQMMEAVQKTEDSLPWQSQLAGQGRQKTACPGNHNWQARENRNNLTSDICRLSSEKKWALTGCKGRKPNVIKSFYLREGELERFNLILQKKYKTIQEKEQRWEGLYPVRTEMPRHSEGGSNGVYLEDSQVILVAYGTMARIAKQVVIELRKKAKKIGLIRPVTLWPFPESQITQIIKKGLHRLKCFLVIEMSYGQMLEDVKLAVNGKVPVHFYGRAGGGVPTEGEIINKIRLLGY